MVIMNKKELAQAVLDAVSACKEFKEAAQNYLDAIGTEREGEAGKALVAEAKEDICTIDHTIEFFESEFGKQIFGAEEANIKREHLIKIQSQGAEYCDCPGCTAAKNIIDNKDLF